jgi:hypothetical protein
MPPCRYLPYLILFLPSLLAAQYECGTTVTPAAKRFMDAVQEAAYEYLPAAGSQNTEREVPVQTHIFNNDQGSGGLTLEEYEAGMLTLNETYAEIGLTFVDCSPPIFYSDDELFEFSADTDVARVSGTLNVPNVINIYVAETVRSSGGGSVCGFAYFPGSFYDLIVMNQRCFTNGSTLSHEVGHYFGLYHTHGKFNCGSLTDELVDGSNCATAGDDICDTPADPNLLGPDCDGYLVDSDCNYTGSGMDANGQLFAPDVRNLMSYAPKRCRNRLSPGQFDRVQFFLDNGREYLDCTPIVRPDNDLCTAATTISCGEVVTGSTTFATGLTTAVECATFDMTRSRGVWYKIAGRRELVTLSLCNSDYDTQIAVFSGDCSDLNCVVRNDDACNRGSEVTFLANGGEDYYVYVHGYQFATGTYELAVSCEAVDCPPPTGLELTDRGINFLNLNWDAPGDSTVELRYAPRGSATFTDIAPASAPVSIPVDPCMTYDVQLRTICDGRPGGWGAPASFASTCDPDYCYSYGYAAQTWIKRVSLGTLDRRSGSDGGYVYQQTPTELVREREYQLTLRANEGAADRKVYWRVYLDVNQDGTFADSADELLVNTDATGNGPVTAPITIAAGRRDGPSRLRVICSSAPIPSPCARTSAQETEDYLIDLAGGNGPENERCINAIPIACGETVSGETFPDGFIANPPYCTRSFTGNGQWFAVRGTGTELTVSMCGSDYDTALGVYTGACDALECVTANDDGRCGLQSEVTFMSVPDETYYIFATGFSTATGTFTLSLECEEINPELVNTVCTGALPLTCGETVEGWTTYEGPISPPAACGMAFTGPGRWFTLTGTGDEFTLDLCNSDYDTALGVYSGSCEYLTCVGADDDGSCGTSSAYSFVSVPDETYYVFVGGYQGAAGNFALSLECTLVCPEPTFTSGCLARPYYRMDEPNGATFRFDYPNTGPDSGAVWLIDGNVLAAGDSTSIDASGNLTHTFAREGRYEVCYSRLDDDGCVLYCCEEYLITFESQSSPDIAVALSEDISGMNGQLLTDDADDIYWYSVSQGEVSYSNTGATVAVPFVGLDSTTCREQTLFASYRTGDGHWGTKMTTWFMCEPDGCGTRISSSPGPENSVVCTTDVPLDNISWLVDGVAQTTTVDSAGALSTHIGVGVPTEVCVTGYNASLDRYRSCCQIIERTTSTSTTLPVRNWSIYPNPAGTSFGLRGGPPSGLYPLVQLYNVRGVLLRSWSQSADEVFQLGQLADGIYFLRLSSGGATQIERLVVKAP